MNSILANGINYSWANIIITLLGGIPLGVTEISYKKGLHSVNNYGQGNQPVSIGYGNQTYSDGSMTLYTDEVRQIAKNAPIPGDITSIPPFSMTLIMTGNGVNYTTDKLSNIRFTEDPFSSKQGDTAITCRVSFAYAGLVRTTN